MNFCGLQCRRASFPKDDSVDGSRSCRTFIALYCKIRRGLVHKNAPCADREEAGKKKTVRGK